MPIVLDNTILVIIISTLIFIVFAIGFLGIALSSNRRIITEQSKNLEIVKKSEERYKALFENSVAGIIKFNYKTGTILEANQSMYFLFNSTSFGELQKIWLALPAKDKNKMTLMLTDEGKVEEYMFEVTLSNGIKRMFLFSARRDGSEDIAYGVMIFITAYRRIG